MIVNLQQLLLQQVVVILSFVDGEKSFFSTWILGDFHDLVALNDTVSWNAKTRILAEMPTAIVAFTSILLDSLAIAVDDARRVLGLLLGRLS